MAAGILHVDKNSFKITSYCSGQIKRAINSFKPKNKVFKHSKVSQLFYDIFAKFESEKV
jgi:hypothetical protein